MVVILGSHALHFSFIILCIVNIICFRGANKVVVVVVGPGLRPGRGHCVVFLGKTLSASLHPGVYEYQRTWC